MPVNGTVLRVRAALIPLPSTVSVTCFPTSMHWSWFPPKDHINTGRLCSAGSESPTSSPTSKLVCSPPTSSPPSAATSVPLAHGLPRCRSLFFAGRACSCQHAARRRRITGSPQDRVRSRRGKDLPGYWAVPFVRAMVEHPAGYDPSSPLLLFEKIYGEAVVCLQAKQNPRHPERHSFRGRNPTAHTLACLRFAGLVAETVARLTTGPGGLTPGRAGFAPAGRRIEVSWSHRSLPSPSTSRAWSH